MDMALAKRGEMGSSPVRDEGEEGSLSFGMEEEGGADEEEEEDEDEEMEARRASFMSRRSLMRGGETTT